MVDERNKFRDLFAIYGDPHRAAHEVFPDDPQMALTAANEWAEESQETEYAESDVPHGKRELATLVWDRLSSSVIEDKDFTALGRVYAEICGFIGNSGTNVNIKNSAEKMDINLSEINTASKAERVYKKMIGEESEPG